MKHFLYKAGFLAGLGALALVWLHGFIKLRQELEKEAFYRDCAEHHRMPECVRRGAERYPEDTGPIYLGK